MRLVEHQIEYAHRYDSFKLYYLTDLHLGAKACDEALLKRHIKRIQEDPFARWIGGGDFLDCIARKGDKRYNEETLAPWLAGVNDAVGTQRDYAIALLEPIADKCLAMIEGNHERAALDWYDRNIYAELCKPIAHKAKRTAEALMLGVQGYVKLNFAYRPLKAKGCFWSMTAYCHHGFGGGRLPGGHALALGRVLGDYDCDIAFMGHRHVRQHVEKAVTRVRRGKVELHERVGAFVASYLDSYIIPSSDRQPIDSYAEHKGLPPGPVGASMLMIEPNAREFHLIPKLGKASTLRLERLDVLAADDEALAA